MTGDELDLVEVDFIEAMARVPGPVAIVTTRGTTGAQWGFTGSSLSSLSLDPPLVLVCLAKTASTHPAFVTADRYLVNVLSADQSDVARRFATSGVDRFAAGDMQACELGLPGLAGASVRLACERHAVLDGGDHSILIGRVVGGTVGAVDAGGPLIYCGRSFSRSAPLSLH